MNDPFDVLRDVPPAAEPDVGAIKSRASRIERRQRIVVGASALSVAAIALVAVLVSVGPQSTPNQIASESRDDTTADSVEGVAPLEMQDSAASPEAMAGKTKAGSEVVSGPSAAGPASEDHTTGATGGAGANAKASAPEPLRAKVTAEGRPLGGAEFTLEVCNSSDDSVTREFGDSQRYDFRVTDEGEKVWQWSDGKAFAQMTGEESWKAKECKEWTESWDSTTTGDFKVVGWLTSEPEVRSKAVAFCTGIC